MSETILGKYKLLETLGKGGFGVVYHAIDQSLERDVALKVLHPALAADGDFLTRFRSEAKIVARFRHPNIVGVYEVGEEDGRFFIAMEFMPGGTLQQRLENKGALPYPEALEIMQQVCAGLETAHAQGLVHRDIKPANILFGADGQAVISDFGLVKAAQLSTGSATSSGTVGTPFYKAPELWRGKPPASPATDVYALACVFYEMLSGRVLFSGDTPDEVITKHLVLPLEFGPGWPPSDAPAGLEAVLAQALERQPDKRQASAGAFASSLAALARPATQVEPVKPLISDTPVIDAEPLKQMLETLPTGETTRVSESPVESAPPIPTLSLLSPYSSGSKTEVKKETSNASHPFIAPQTSSTTPGRKGRWKWVVGIVVLAGILMMVIGFILWSIVVIKTVLVEQPAPTEVPTLTAEPPPTEAPKVEPTAVPTAGLPDLGGKVITVAVENAYPPFNSIDQNTNQGVGWDYDTVTEICKRINCKPEFKQAAWDGIFPAMQAGEFDMLADGVTITDERAKIVAFSIPYVTVGQVLLVRADETATVDAMKADAKVLVGTQIGTTNEIVAKENFPQERVKSFEDFGAAVLALLSGDVDGVVIDNVSAAGFIGENQGKLKIAGTLTSDEKLGFVFPPGSELKAAVDAALQSMIDDGTLATLNKKWGLTQ